MWYNIYVRKRERHSAKNEKEKKNMRNLNESATVLKSLRAALIEAKENALNDLVEFFTENGNLTAAEVGKATGLTSREVVGLIISAEANYKPIRTCGRKRVVKTYVLLNEDGTVDMEKKCRQIYRVNVYGVKR